MNSGLIIRQAREIYFDYINNSAFKKKPRGVVINTRTGKGKVVINNPTLLPDENFLCLDKIISKNKSKKKTRKNIDIIKI